MIGRVTSIALALFLAVSSAHATPFATKLVQTSITPNAERIAKVMRGAKTLKAPRRIDEEEAEIDISGYFLKYMKCQSVKSYDTDLAEDEDSGTVLSVSRFAIFRLCPSDTDCSEGYGEYLVDLDTFLESAVEYAQEYQENKCNACDEYCTYNDAAEADDGGRKLHRIYVDCSVCVDECTKIENMEDNGYLDASNFLECQQIYESDDDSYVAYYSGATCSNSGNKIKIGVFLDEDCTQLDNSLSTETFTGYKLSYALLKSIYSSDTGFSCTAINWEKEDDYGDNQNDDEEEEVEVTDMCANLYERAAKCESVYGFADSYSNYEGYENQASQEDTVCSFINSIKNGAYDQTGEIVLTGSSNLMSGRNATTGAQKFALTFFTIGSVGLAFYALQLISQLSGGSKTDFGWEELQMIDN